MKCPKCKNETFLDHVEKWEGLDKYFYVCVNPQCTEHRKDFSPSGEEAEMKIKPKAAK